MGISLLVAWDYKHIFKFNRHVLSLQACVHRRADPTTALREAGVNSSNFANPDPELAVRMLLAVSQELVHLRLTKPRVYTIDRLVAQAERLIEVMFPH